MPHLPSLTVFRALEAAFRHRSYSRAAGELNLTHSAVSHHIRQLERELGASLFQRRGNGMEPLPAAARLAVSVAEALALLERGMAEAGDGRNLEPMVLSAEQGFARRWLTPRLMRMREEIDEPELDLRLENRLADLVGDGIDAAVRYGNGIWPGLEVSPLFKVRMFPVCSPRFLEKYPLAEIQDLHAVPLLRHAHPLWSWPAWFRSLGLVLARDRGMMFDDSSLMLEAAAQSLGVALARSNLVQSDLESGRLVRPLPAEVESSWGYFFVWRKDAPKLERILALRDWLLREVQAESDGRGPKLLVSVSEAEESCIRDRS